MDDEPSKGELARRLDRIEALLVSRNEMTLALAHLQSQIEGVDNDLKALLAEKSSKGQSKVNAAYSFAGQIVGGLILAAIIAWVAGKGGH